MAQTNLIKLDRVQNEAIRVIQGTVLDESSRGLNTASMPADRAQANQGVGTQTDSGVFSESTVENGQQANQGQRSSLILIKN